MHACIIILYYLNAEGGVGSDGLILKQKADGRLYLVDVLDDPNDNQGSIDMHTCPFKGAEYLMHTFINYHLEHNIIHVHGLINAYNNYIHCSIR